MKSFAQKGLLCILVSVMLLAGCGTTPATPSASASAAASTAASETAAASASETASDPVADVAFPPKEMTKLTAFVMTPFAGANGDYNNNYVTDYIRKNANIDITFTNASGDDGKTKLNLLMASGDTLPDFFLTTKWTKAETLLYGKQGLIIPLTEMLKDAPNWNMLNTKAPFRKGDLTLPDGNIYTYGDCNECFHCNYQSRMWIYKPWVDKLAGGKMPTTTDELYTFLKAVKEKDPNGNGKADEIPLTGHIAAGGWATDPTTFLINSFIQCNNMLSNTNPIPGAGFVINNGKVEYQFVKDGYREALVYLNKLYKEGLLDSQAFTQDGTQTTASTQAEPNLVALASGGWWPSKVDELFVGQDGPYQDWTMLEPVKGPNGVQLAPFYPNGYFGSCVGTISADCKNPELVVKLFDYLASEEMSLIQVWGPKGIAWDSVTEGTSISGGKATYKQIPAEKKKEDGTPDYTAFGLDFAKYNWDTDAAILNNTSDVRLALFSEDPNRSVEGLLYQYGKLYSKYKPEDATVMPNLAFEEDDARKIADYTVSIGKYVNQATVQFITGDLNIETDWQTYLDKLNGMDVAGYVAVQQKGYDAFMKSLGN